jgi:chlorite dismutase
MSSPAAEAAADALQTESNAEQTPEGYTVFAVFRKDPARPDDLDGHDVPRFVDELDGVIATVEDEGVTLRGIYDVSGLRADADVMLWLHGPTAEGLQWAIRQMRRSRLFRALLPTWNAMGVHRDAEFNRAHVPGFLRGVEPKGWLTVYPFVRSYEWYLLPPEERGRMLAEHGRKGAAFTRVVANTVASFSLGDYEWLLPLEADDPTELVDLMRDLRYTDARRYVKEEVPFYTGRRLRLDEIADVLQ